MNERAGLTPERWERIEHLLESALEKPKGERLEFLAGACGDDERLRAQVEALIAAHLTGDGPLERIALALGGSIASENRIDNWVGRTIGPYSLVKEIGRGGMGVVFLARRSDGQYERDVALKLIRSPFCDERERERFFAERQILARLTHPGIAQLFDGGVTSDGLPYFTMEYVDGVPIDVFADTQRLDITARLSLFTKVCDAVAAAHRSLVVHRDLKPANILVTAAGDVKLLDFGVAKPLQPSADQVTGTGIAPFTPDYASPEQVRGEQMTTASDVYSLGAVLYESIAGVRPHQFTARTPAEVERTICDAEPRRPSRAFAALRATDPAAAERFAKARAIRADRLEARVIGDLDTIALKALNKDAGRRYRSVDLLREDLVRHIQGLPVLARPDNWMYRARKFAGRHTVAVASAAVVLVVLAAGVVTTFLQARRVHEQSIVAAAERVRAETEAARAKRVSALLTDIFRLADPGRTSGETITAREILDRGTRRVETELAGDPETQSAVFDAVSQVYRNLALYDDADRLLARSLALRTATFGAGSLEVAETLHNIGVLQLERSHYPGAEQRFIEALAIRRRYGAPGPLVAASLEGLAQTLSEAGRPGEAEGLLREALTLRQQAPSDPADQMMTVSTLALALVRKGEVEQAERLFREAVELGKRLGSAATPATISSTLNLARLTYRFDHNPRRAEPLYRDALALARRLYPEDHPQVANLLSELARCLRDQGTLAEAETMTRDALAIWRRLYGNTHRQVMISLETLAGLLADRGKPDEAEPLFREALMMGRALLGSGHGLVLGAQGALASFLESNRRWTEAQGLRENELAVARQEYGDTSVYVARAYAGLGSHRLARGQPAEAEADFRRALDIRLKIHPPDHWRVAEAKALLGGCLTKARRMAEAEPLLRDAVESLRKSTDAPPVQLQNATATLVSLYESSGRKEDAARYRMARASSAGR